MTYTYDMAFRQHVQSCLSRFCQLQNVEGTISLIPAAVAVTLADARDGSGRAALLLTRRAASLRSHRNQWALPGGRCDTGETAAAAALRELNEELGLLLSGQDVLGKLDDYPTRSGYLIKPVVVWSGQNADLTPNPLEVASVHRIPLDDLAQEDALSFIAIPESDRPVIRLRVGERFVHAPTAAIIYQFLEVLAGRLTRVTQFEQPVFAWR